jgi:predicted Holliday junction resolvase-like endonuclease
MIEMFEIISLTLFVIVLILIALYVKSIKRIRELEFEKSSILVKHGKAIEQFFPFLENYPYSKNNFRFIGSPIDGIQFEDDKIIFIEFKTSNSKLSENQRRIKEIIEKKNVYFEELRI